MFTKNPYGSWIPFVFSQNHQAIFKFYNFYYVNIALERNERSLYNVKKNHCRGHGYQQDSLRQ